MIANAEFGTSPFTTPAPASASGELETAPASDRVSAPPVGESVALSRGPLVEQNARVQGVDGTEYVLGLDYFETLSLAPGYIENIGIEEGTALVVDYFYYESISRGADGTSPVVSAPEAPQARRFANMMKFGF